MPVTRRQCRAIACCIAGVALYASCNDATAPVSDVILRASADSLFFGDSLQLDAVALGDSATVSAPAFLWTSSDTTVALVDSRGMVRGLSTGVATITAEFGGRRSEFVVRVVLFRADGGVSFAAMARGIHDPVCALSIDGQPYCEVLDDELRPTFVPLPGGGGLIFTSFHVSFHSQCGLTTLGLMYCWGRNGHNHFGNGTPQSFRADSAPALGAHGRTFKALTVGGHAQTCGVNAADDVVYCFGHNDFSQVGRGTRSGEDTAVAPTGGSPRGKAVTTSEFRSCLLTLDGGPMCWGGDGQTPVPVPAPEPFASIANGGGHSCAFGESGTLYCWALNASGEAGVGSNEGEVAEPTPVTGGIEFADVFPSGLSTCAVTADGALYCWGDFAPLSVSSRLGNARFSPVRILPALRFRSVMSIGLARRTCAVTTDGRLYCWK
jgi:hypothetical protein